MYWFSVLTEQNMSDLQKYISKRMGTQKSNISRLERGSSNPSWKTLQNYAHACGFELTVNIQNLN